MKNIQIQLEIISKEEKWWAKLSIENFSGNTIWLNEQLLFGESLKSNLFTIKTEAGDLIKYIGFAVNSSVKKYIELKNKETKIVECNLSKAYKIEKDVVYSFQYAQPVLYTQNPETTANAIPQLLDSGEVQLNAKEVSASLTIKHFDGLLIAELEFKNNSKRDIWLDMEAVGGTKILKRDVFKITNAEGEICTFKNVSIERNNIAEERFIKLEPQEYYWTRNNLSSKYNVPKNENISIQYSSDKAYAYLKPVEDDKDTLLPMASNVAQFTLNAVNAALEITQDGETIYANLTFTNNAKTDVWLNTKYLGSEDLEYNVFTFQDDNGMPYGVTFKPKITSHEYEYDVNHFIELAPGDSLQTQVNLNRNYILEEQGRYMIKYEAPALMWKKPKELKDYDEYSEDDDAPYFDTITSERVKMKIDDAADPLKMEFDVIVKGNKAYAMLTLTATSSKAVRLDSRKIGGEMMGTDIFQLQNSYGIYAEFKNPKHDDNNEETIVLEKGDTLTTETCLNNFYEIETDVLYTVRLMNGLIGIDLKQWDDEKTAKSFTIPPAENEQPKGPLAIEFTHEWGSTFEIHFINKSKKPLWINTACMSPETTKFITLHQSNGTEINRTEKSEPYTDWAEITPGDRLSNPFDITSFWKCKEQGNYQLKFNGPVYTLKDPYSFEDERKIKLETVATETKVFEV